MSEITTFPKNALLTPCNILIGKWSVTMTHHALPAPLTWQDNFEWLENAFILWHWQGKNEVPQATSIVSRSENDAKNRYRMFYYDSRGVSRLFDMSLENGVWKFWREGADFFQRFEGKISDDGTLIMGKGENSHDGGKSWEDDYNITYNKL